MLNAISGINSKDQCAIIIGYVNNHNVPTQMFNLVDTLYRYNRSNMC